MAISSTWTGCPAQKTHLCSSCSMASKAPAPRTTSAACSPSRRPGIGRPRLLRTLKRKSLAKLKEFPGAADADRVRRARTLFEFDDALTARVHGFGSAPDYYAQSSSRSFVERVQVPLLLLSAADDPFIPAQCIPRPTNRSVTLEISAEGGHLGFVEGQPWRPR